MMSDYMMPPEWARQTAVWLSWPGNPAHWGGKRMPQLVAKFAEIGAAISRYEGLRINAPAAAHGGILAALREAGAELGRCELFDHPNNDVWCRDHGPIFVKRRGSGELAVTDWGFNGWGDKFGPYDLDNRIPERIATALGLERIEGGMILEGGSIEVNGCGQLLTTEAVLLNPNRNPAMDRAGIEARLRTHLGVSEILWLKDGIAGDDTDGHIDDLARFVSDTTILAATDPGGANERVLADNLRCLGEFRTPAGRPFELIEMPLPAACEVPGWRLPQLPASYVNFLIINGAVLMPGFGQQANDARAAAVLAEQFPGREIVVINCLELVEEGGSLHCISQQQPA
jgi:agmatine deiminase